MDIIFFFIIIVLSVIVSIIIIFCVFCKQPSDSRSSDQREISTKITLKQDKTHCQLIETVDAIVWHAGVADDGFMCCLPTPLYHGPRQNASQPRSAPTARESITSQPNLPSNESRTPENSVVSGIADSPPSYDSVTSVSQPKREKPEQMLPK